MVGWNVKPRLKRFGGGTARDDRPFQVREQSTFNVTQNGLLSVVQAGLQRDRMMDQSDRASRGDRVLQTTEGRHSEPVDDRFGFGRQSIPGGTGGIAGAVVDQWKHAGQLNYLDL